MSDIVRQQSPATQSGAQNQYRPDELNAELAAAALARELVAKWPKPTISSKKFTVIHGLMLSLNHKEPVLNSDGTVKEKGNPTYLDVSPLIELMDRVDEKSVNVEGKLFTNLFAYLMHPKYIIQGMPQAGQVEEEKPGLISRLIGGITGRNKTQEGAK
jgi:hypothetical protein